MRLLLIHADFLEFQAKQPTPIAEPVPDELRSGRVEEALVAFIAVEEGDEEDPESIAEKAADEIEGVYKQLEARRIVLYPYAHLSSSLASPAGAVRVLDLTRDALLARGLEVLRLPFGWYKAFKLSCKGHPLSELSRTITPEVAEEPEEAKPPSEYLILTPDGREHELDLKSVDACGALEEHPLLKRFVLSEELGVKSGEEPPHIKLMRRLELVDYEPASDTGHFRFYPKGALIKGLLEDLAVQLANELGASRIETPALYRADEPDISEQASKFLQKDYRIKLPGRPLLLRFAGDFGLFRMMRDAVMSYRQMPVRIFELSPSYRLEQSGECVGLKRLRAFTMPDVHCFCRDLGQGLEEYERLFLKYTKLVDAMEVEYVVAFRVVKEFYEGNKGFIAGLLERIGKPALIELLPEMKHYWVMKHEFQEVDSVGGNAQLATVQLDVEDSERYGIFYVDERGEKRGCIILHSSMGSIERWIYAMLEEAAKRMKEGKPPGLPLWLSPTQVRLCTVNESFIPFAEEIASQLEKQDIRVDIDDRGESVGKKIRDAEVEWVNVTIVVGGEERESGRFRARVREDRSMREMGLEEVVELVKSRTKDYPFRPLPLPRLLSKRPAFVG
ncbi:MAG: threonine--tRNA ligase [Candidatus Hodarchaeaceae archaeon]|nr:threonine--tRNA ligase [Candidatus Hodarchaeaceae archaeon]